MVHKTRKKNSRQRAGTTHGWGSMKKHRGKGNKGGSGMAGTGKRGDAKKPSIWKNKRYFGKFGFKKKGMIEKVYTINIDEIQNSVEKWTIDKKIQQEGDVLNINLAELGKNKLLGRGKVTKKMNLTVEAASKMAIAKIKEAGGQVTVKQ